MLYKEFVKWCSDNGEHVISQRDLSGRLTERGLQSKRDTQGNRVWSGIGLKTPEEAFELGRE
jgi:hypothetical protein